MPISSMRPAMRSALFGPLVGKWGGGFSPEAVFANGEDGGWLLPGTEFGVCYTERTGASATTVCGHGDPVGTYHCLITNTYLTAPSDDARPIYTVDGELTYLQFDGIDDFLSRPLPLSAYPLFAAASAQADADQLGGVVSFGTAVDTQYRALQKTATANQWAANDRQALNVSDVLVVGTNATPHTLMADFRETSVELTMDGTTNGPTAHANAIGVTTLFYGKVRPGGLFFAGRAYGALAINVTPTASANIKTFLDGKAGIGLGEP